MSVPAHKLVDLALLTQYTNNGVIPLKNHLIDVTERVETIEDYIFEEHTYTLLAENWEENDETGEFTYSLEEEYPSANYNVDIYLDDNLAQPIQRDSFVDAILYGGTDNIIHVGNEAKVPSIDIPIILKVVAKNAESS